MEKRTPAPPALELSGRHPWKDIVASAFDEFEGVTIEPASLEPDEADLDPASDVVRTSLEDPIESAPLSVRLQSVASVTIVLPDATRSLGEEVVVGVTGHIKEYASAGTDVRFLVATGLHRRPSPEEMKSSAHLRAAVESGYPVHIHSARAARPVPCEPHPVINPATGRVVPVWLNPMVTDVDLVVSLSTVELHQYAGFSGGYKSIAVGCAGTRTIAEVHGLPLLRMEGTRIGALTNNPFRSMLTSVGKVAAPVFSVHEAWGRNGKAYASGDPQIALALMSRRPDAVYFTEIGPHDAAIIEVDAAKSANLYQASRAYTYLVLQENPPIVPGAPVLLVADCPDGFGDGEGEVACRLALSEGLAALARELDSSFIPTGSVGGRQRAYMIARAAQRNPLHILSSYDFGDQLPPGIVVHKDLAAATSALREDSPMLDPDAPMEVLVTRNVFHTLPCHTPEVVVPVETLSERTS